ncbi:MAG: hypothetical protein JNM57_07825 [Cyclobacteriaceae bacterium]|nr:hypothetical protein [Cyclobacteriaceae bacterium]
MKNFLILLFLVLAIASFGQKKGKEKAPAQPDTVALANQKLTAENKTLTLKTDSLTKVVEKYFGLYTVIKDKVVKMDFDPAKMGAIIDSLRAGRDSLSLSAASGVLLRDSISKQNKLIDSLKKETEGLMYTVKLLRGVQALSPSDPKEFVGSWNVILRKVKIEGQSPRAGMIDVSGQTPPKTAGFLEVNSVTNINFIDKEFAELTFSNGEKGKGYYIIEGFSTTKPYYIDFKGVKADIRVYFMNTPLGARISYQIPGTEGLYYFGQMTK